MSYLKIFGTKTKQQILDFLSKNPKKKISVLELHEELSLPQSTLSINLADLDNAKILDSEKKGKYKYYSLKEKHVLTLKRVFADLETISKAAAVFLLFVSVFGTGLASAQMPGTIAIQGKLAMGNETNLTGFYNFTFRIYAYYSGGTELWYENQSLYVNNGSYYGELGRNTTLNLSFDMPYYLGIEVEGNGEMSPRMNISSAPYALRANVSEQNLLRSGDNMTGNLNMTYNNITSVSNLLADVIYQAGQALNSIFLSLSGGTLAGNLNMGGNEILGVGQLVLGWGNLTSVPAWITGNYTGWTNIQDIPHWIANNYTSWAKVYDKPAWTSNDAIQNNYTGWSNIQDIPADIADGDDTAAGDENKDSSGDLLYNDSATYTVNSTRVQEMISNSTSGYISSEEDPYWTANQSDYYNISETNSTITDKLADVNYTTWAKVGEKPDWVENNYTGWSNIQDLPAGLGGDAPDVWVNESGDEITWLNVTQDLNVTGRLNVTDNLSVNEKVLFVDTGSGRVGINTSTPSNALSVNGNSVFTGNIYVGGSNMRFSTSTGFFVFNRPSPYSSSIYFGENADTGNYVFRGSGNLTTERRVGIGTTDPQFPLHVIRSSNDSVDFIAKFENSQDDDALIRFNASSATKQWDIGLVNNQFRITESTTPPEFVITLDGKVGIATESPQNTLNVVGDLNVTGTSYLGDITIESNNITVNNIKSKDGNITFYNDSGSDNVIITQSGRVGIGTDDPDGILEVYDYDPYIYFTATINGRQFKMRPASGYIDSIGTSLVINRESSNNVVLAYGGGNVGVGALTPSHRFTVDDTSSTSMNVSNTLFVDGSSQELGIGASSPSAKLDVNGSFLVQNESNGAVLLYVNQTTGAVGVGITNTDGRLTVGGTGTPSFVVEASTGSDWFSVGKGSPGVVAFNQEGGYTLAATGTFMGARVNIGSLNPANSALTVSGVPGQTEHIFEVNSYGDLEGDLFVINASGDVGVGTRAPSARLDVNGSIHTTGKIYTSRSTTIAPGAGYIEGGGPNVMTFAASTFENKTTGWFPRSGLSLSVNDSYAFSGNKSMRAYSDSAGVQFQFGINLGDVLQNDSEEDFVVSAWIYLPSEGGLSDARWQYRDGGSNFYTGGTVYTSYSVTTLDSWQKLILPFKAEATSGEGFLYIYAGGADTGDYMFIDNVQIQRGTMATEHGPLTCGVDSDCALLEGDMGIGTDPIGKLTIRQSSDTIAKGLSIYGSGGQDYLHIWSNNANVALMQSGDEAAYRDISINSLGGNVGIGNAAPTARLHVTGDANVTSALSVGGRLNVSSYSNFYNIMSISTEGYTSVPFNANYKLQLQDDNILYVGLGTPNSGTGGILFRDPQQTGGGITYSHASETLSLSSAGTYMYLVNGSVGIGTNSPTATLEVSGNANITGTLYGGWPLLTAIKTTNAQHNGSFVGDGLNGDDDLGYREQYEWLQDNGCSGYHLCTLDEISRGIASGIDIDTSELAANNEYWFKIQGGQYGYDGYEAAPVTDCYGWTNDASSYYSATFYMYVNASGDAIMTWPTSIEEDGASICSIPSYYMCCK